VKYAWIDRHRAMYPLALMCALLAVSLNGFRAWLRGGSPNRKRCCGRPKIDPAKPVVPIQN